MLSLPPELTADELGRAAKRLHKSLTAHDPKIPLHLAQEGLARALGRRNWNILHAEAKNAAPTPAAPPHPPAPANVDPAALLAHYAGTVGLDKYSREVLAGPPSLGRLALVLRLYAGKNPMTVGRLSEFCRQYLQQLLQWPPEQAEAVLPWLPTREVQHFMPDLSMLAQEDERLAEDLHWEQREVSGAAFGLGRDKTEAGLRSFTQRLSRLCTDHPEILAGMKKALPVVLSRICELGLCDVPAQAEWRARRIMREQFDPH